EVGNSHRSLIKEEPVFPKAIWFGAGWWLVQCRISSLNPDVASRCSAQKTQPKSVKVSPEEEDTAPRARWLSQTASTFFLFSSPSPPLLSFFFFFSYVLYSPKHALPWLVKRNQVRCFCEVWSPSTSYCAVNSVSVESKTQWRCGACCIL
uniref:Uncharacterized protein n=1 Tax=Gasterosteus aculeatus TaxID=69293 RepID=G3P949_GASAC